MRGRLSTLTPEVADAIVRLVAIGTPLKVAAQANGVGESTLMDWLAAGEGRRSRVEALPIHSDFSERVRKAQGEAHAYNIGIIRQAVGRGNWQAALAWIRMRYPNHYSERLEVTGANGGPIAIEVAQALEGLTEDELASIESHLATSAHPDEARPGGASEA